jgi:hypothetical protein
MADTGDRSQSSDRISAFAMFTYSVRRSALSATSVPVTTEVGRTGVLLNTVNVPSGAMAYVDISADPVSSAYRYRPSGLMTCQHEPATV